MGIIALIITLTILRTTLIIRTTLPTVGLTADITDTMDTGQAFRSVSAMGVIAAVMVAIKAITDTVMAGITAITVVTILPAFMQSGEVAGTTGTLAARQLLTGVLAPEVFRPCALVVHAREASPQ